MTSTAVGVQEKSQVAEARRAALACANALRFDEEAEGKEKYDAGHPRP